MTAELSAAKSALPASGQLDLSPTGQTPLRHAGLGLRWRRVAIALVSAATASGCLPVGHVPPFVVPPPTSPPELLVISEAPAWLEQLHVVLGDVPSLMVPAHGTHGEATVGLLDRWVTDPWVFGHVGTRRAIVQMPGEQGLAAWGAATFTPARGWLSFAPVDAHSNIATRCDSGGNLLVSPPIGAAHPQGCLVVGSCMQKALKHFFADQRVQACAGSDLLELDTSWLRVGHLDEVIGFTGGLGRVVLADPLSGWRLLGSVPPERVLFYVRGSREFTGTVTAAGGHFLEDSAVSLPKGAWANVRIIAGTGRGQVASVTQVSPHRLAVERVWDLRPSPSLAVARCQANRCDAMPIWFEVPDATSRYVLVEGSQMWIDGAGDPFPAIVTAGELLSDPELSAAALAVAKKLLGRDGIEGAVERAFPTLGWIQPAALFAAAADGRQAWAFVPSPANLIAAGSRALVLRPFGPRLRPPDDESDVFAASWKAAFAAAAVDLTMADAWMIHRGGGGARCAVNIVR